MFMKELSIAQEYLLCVVSEKGKVPSIAIEVPACILASGLLELIMGGQISMNERKIVSVSGELGVNQGHLASLMAWLKKTGDIKLDKIAEEYCMGFSSKKLNALITDIGNSLSDRGCVEVRKGGFFSGLPLFVPNSEEVEKIIQKIRAELLEDGDISEETMALISLLEKSNRIKSYFSAHEAKQLKARLKEVKETPASQMIKQIIEYIETILSAIIAAASVVH
jgi:uncharacterized protein (UPF0297 family)